MDGGDSFLMGDLSLYIFTKRIVKSYALFFMKFLSRGLYYLALFPVFVWIGSQVRGTEDEVISLKQVGYILLLWMIFLLINVAMFIYGVGYVESRALCFMSFVLVTITGYLGIRVGMSYKKESMILYAVLFNTSAMFISLLWFIKTDMPLVKEYNQYVTTRNWQIENKVQYYKSNGIPAAEQTAYVCAPFRDEPKIPLIVSELTEDPNNWRNDGLKRYYHADFDIICKSKIIEE